MNTYKYNPQTKTLSKGEQQTLEKGRWKKEESNKFLQFYLKHPNDYTKYLKEFRQQLDMTRTNSQIRSHAQKKISKLEKLYGEQSRAMKHHVAMQYRREVLSSRQEVTQEILEKFFNLLIHDDPEYLEKTIVSKEIIEYAQDIEEDQEVKFNLQSYQQYSQENFNPETDLILLLEDKKCCIKCKNQFVKHFISLFQSNDFDNLMQCLNAYVKQIELENDPCDLALQYVQLQSGKQLGELALFIIIFGTVGISLTPAVFEKLTQEIVVQ